MPLEKFLYTNGILLLMYVHFDCNGDRLVGQRNSSPNVGSAEDSSPNSNDEEGGGELLSLKSKTAPCCSCNGLNTRCKSCSCVKEKRHFVNCRAAKHVNCSNQSAPHSVTNTPSKWPSTISAKAHSTLSSSSPCTHTTQTKFMSSFQKTTSLIISSKPHSQQTQMRQHPVMQLSSSQHLDSTSDSAILSNDSIEDTKLKQTFGASLDHKIIAVDEMWCKRWNKIVSSSRHYYDLPGGAVEREFVDVLAEEVNLFKRSSVCSQRLIVLLALMLQRDSMVNKGRDIRRLLKRHMMTWKSEHFDEILFDFKRCLKHHKRCNHMKSDESHIAKFFTHLMMKGGQVGAAVCWITKRTSKGGVLDASTYVGSGSKTVLDILKENTLTLLNHQLTLFYHAVSYLHYWTLI